jgi:hypothetical protein
VTALDEAAQRIGSAAAVLSAPRGPLFQTAFLDSDGSCDGRDQHDAAFGQLPI